MDVKTWSGTGRGAGGADMGGFSLCQESVFISFFATLKTPHMIQDQTLAHAGTQARGVSRGLESAGGAVVQFYGQTVVNASPMFGPQVTFPPQNTGVHRGGENMRRRERGKQTIAEFQSEL